MAVENEGWQVSFWPSFLFLISCWTLFWLLGKWFFAHLLYRDLDFSKTDQVAVLCRTLFCTVFAVCGTMLQLLGLELVTHWDQEARELAWAINMALTLGLAYILLPFVFCWCLLAHAPRVRSMLSVLAVCLWWRLGVLGSDVFNISLLIGLAEACIGLGSSGALLLSRLGQVGVVAVAALSGFGAVMFPHSAMSALYRPVTRKQMADCEYKYMQTMKQIIERKYALIDLSSSLGSNSRGASAERKGWFSWLGMASDSPEQARKNRIDDLAVEIQALEKLSVEIYSELTEMVASRRRTLYASTIIGRVKNLAGWFCAVVCIYKVFMSSVNFTFSRVGQTSPATRLLSILLRLGSASQEEAREAVEYWAPLLSLLFLGWLALSSVRSFIQILLKSFRRVGTSSLGARAPSGIVVALSLVMLLYFCACVLLLRVQLPESHRRGFMGAGEGVDFRSLHLEFDAVFLVTSLTTIGGLSASHWFSCVKAKVA